MLTILQRQFGPIYARSILNRRFTSRLSSLVLFLTRIVALVPRID